MLLHNCPGTLEHALPLQQCEQFKGQLVFCNLRPEPEPESEQMVCPGQKNKTLQLVIRGLLVRIFRVLMSLTAGSTLQSRASHRAHEHPDRIVQIGAMPRRV